MKKILIQLQDFLRLYPLAFWFCFFGFNAISVFLYYSDGAIAFLPRIKSINFFISKYLLYAFHYFFSIFLIYLFLKKEIRPKLQINSIILITFSFLFFVYRGELDCEFYLSKIFGNLNFNELYKGVLNQFFQGLNLLVPLWVIWYLKDRRNQPPYGFSFLLHDSKTYWVLFGFMLPLLFLAGTQKDFLDYYPRGGLIYGNGGSIFLLILYELAYGFDFLSIEMFFRGFLILGFYYVLGKHAILPMASFYMAIHFGKPLGETVSSLFGGLILGVITYHSKSIYGGLFVHIGIAWCMELIGFLKN